MIFCAYIKSCENNQDAIMRCIFNFALRDILKNLWLKCSNFTSRATLLLLFLLDAESAVGHNVYRTLMHKLWSTACCIPPVFFCTPFASHFLCTIWPFFLSPGHKVWPLSVVLSWLFSRGRGQ